MNRLYGVGHDGDRRPFKVKRRGYAVFFMFAMRGVSAELSFRRPGIRVVTVKRQVFFEH